jgi:Family of unknown function (DUF6527)
MTPRPLWWRRFLARFSPRRVLTIIESDSLPEQLPRRNLVLAREDGEDWCVGLRCPCGCGERLEMMMLENVTPRWDIALDKQGRVSLLPSVFRRVGCRSHFWVRAGRIVWCE